MKSKKISLLGKGKDLCDCKRTICDCMVPITRRVKNNSKGTLLKMLRSMFATDKAISRPVSLLKSSSVLLCI